MVPPLNKNNSAVKRILQEARELANDTSTEYTAAPLEDNIFEWHCTLRGPAGTDYEGGLYHFRIKLPAEYPFRPPAIQMLTPSGRFELNTNICISFTNYHEESWQPAWGVRTAIIGLQGFFPLNGKDAIGVGGIEYPSAERKRLAKASRDWICPTCQKSNLDCLPDPGSDRPATEDQVESEQYRLPDSPERVARSDQQEVIPQLPQPPLLSSVASPPTTVATHSSPSSPRVEDNTIASANALATPRASKPPILLDTVICFVLVLIVAIIYRRVL